MPMRNKLPLQHPAAPAVEVRPLVRTASGAMHPSPLTPEDYAFIANLPEQRVSDRVRSDMALLVTDEDTQAALERYRDFFAFGGVNVDPAIEALPRLMQLLKVQKHMTLAMELLQRHITAASEPVVSVTSDVHRLVIGTPEGSAVRSAFATFDERWRDTFRGGRTVGTDEAPAPTPSPAQPK